MQVKSKGFTFIEIVIAVSILSILIAIARISYLKAIARARAAGCRTNLNLIKHSLDNYALEYDVFPLSLAQLKPRHINKAYAELIIAKEDIFTKFGYYLIWMKEEGKVYAQSPVKSLGLNQEILNCPASAGGNSYGASVLGISSTVYQAQSNDLLTVADCKQETFSSLAEVDSERHSKGLIKETRFANGITKGGQLVEIYPDKTVYSTENNTQITNLIIQPDLSKGSDQGRPSSLPNQGNEKATEPIRTDQGSLNRP